MATTSRVLAGLCRRARPPTQRRAAPILARRPISAAAARPPPCAPPQPGPRPQAQRRGRSDTLKQRALSALKEGQGGADAAADAPADGVRSAKAKRGGVDGGGLGAFTKATADAGIGGAGRGKAAPAVDGGVAAVGTRDAVPAADAAVPDGASATQAAIGTGTGREKNDGGGAAPAAPADAPADAPGQTRADAPAAASDPAAAPSAPFAHVHLHEFAPKIVVAGVGGAGTNAVNNMVASGLAGVEFLALNTDAQHLSQSISPTRLQIGTHLTSGLGCGANPDAGRLAAEESSEAIQACIEDAHMVFITAGMGGGTGTGAAPVVAGLCYELGILTVSVVTTPFRFEGTHRARLAAEGVGRLKEVSDTLIVVPNQNLFRLVGEGTSFVDSFKLADDVLLAGVRSITDLMTSPGLINLDFADVQSVMHGMGNALLGTGQACNDAVPGGRGPGAAGGDGDPGADGDGDAAPECRAIRAAKMALNNPLLGEGNMDVRSAKGMLVNLSGGSDMTLYEVDRAAEYITERVVDPDANIIFGSAYDESLTGCVRVSVVATGIEEEG